MKRFHLSLSLAALPLAAALAACELPATARAEQLAPQRFVALWQATRPANGAPG